ncbi:Hint domain-containing protein [Paracoccus sp. SCSIO 75233]|uniref:Hint domain-containing protein n=1 Tax=Paracoccus sp. SCSIO 75233 TaxID=3017782 RepID=UPI0022EFE10A|nr:Hint domain-containing protein [Paracoccus sp. SCSIO 75233]WBU53907.1 Hint domain-containing protein [Paracoccus sp. SCSIO 75233]
MPIDPKLIYYIDSQNDLYARDPQSGTETLLGNYVPSGTSQQWGDITTLTLTDGSTELIGVTRTATPTDGPDIYRLDPDTPGTATLLFDGPQGGESGAVAGAPDGTLYYTHTKLSGSYLFELDRKPDGSYEFNSMQSYIAGTDIRGLSYKGLNSNGNAEFYYLSSNRGDHIGSGQLGIVEINPAPVSGGNNLVLSKTPIDSTLPQDAEGLGQVISHFGGQDTLVLTEASGELRMLVIEDDKIISNSVIGTAGSVTDEADIFDLAGEGHGNDSLSGGADNDTITGHAGDDSLSGGGGNDSITAADGTDSIYGGTADDSADGGADGDLIEGGTGKDTLSGGKGDDTIFGDNAAGNADDRILTGYITGENLTVNSGDFNFGTSPLMNFDVGEATRIRFIDDDNTLGGDVTNEQISGTGQVEINGQIYGYAADFVITATGPNPSGNGTVPYKFIVVDVDLDGDGNLGLLDGAEPGEDGKILIPIGTPPPANTTLNVTTSGNSYDGSSKFSELDAYSPPDNDDLMDGGQGNDRLYGGTGADTMSGDEGGDTISGGLGDDSAEGGFGDDVIEGGFGDDTLRGGDGGDTISGDHASGGGNDYVAMGYISGRNATLTSGGFHNPSVSSVKFETGEATAIHFIDDDAILDGDAVNEVVDGTGKVEIDGNIYSYVSDYLLQVTTPDPSGVGTVTYDFLVVDVDLDNDGSLGSGTSGEPGEDGKILIPVGTPPPAGAVLTFKHMEEPDTGMQQFSLLEVRDNPGLDDLIDGGEGDDSLSGGMGDDTLEGATGLDTLQGGEGDDSLSGGAENDSLSGGYGEDTLQGGDGDDTIWGEGHNGAPGPIDHYVVTGYIDGQGITVESGHFHEASTSFVEFTLGQTTEIRFFDDDGLLDKETINEKIAGTGRVEIGDRIYNYVADYILNATAPDPSGGGGTVTYTFIVVDADLDSDNSLGGQPSSEPGEDGAILIPLGEAPPPGTTLNYLSLDNSGAEAKPFTEINGRPVPGYDDLIEGGTGADRLYGEEGADTLDGGDGTDSLDGGEANDSLSGGGDDDTLEGGIGADTLDGGAGDDRIIVRSGDSAKGGSGSDLFVIDASPTEAAATITIEGGDPISSDVNDSVPGDRITLADGMTVVENSYSATSIPVSGAVRSHTGTVKVTDGDKVYTVDFSNIEDVRDIACFVRGTLIETDDGPKPIETLKTGDLVLTRDSGLKPIRWIGSTALSADRLEKEPQFCPIRIAADALAPGYPAEDLHVSPQHRILLRSAVAQRMFGEDEILAAAKQLLEMDGIEQIGDAGGVEYFHFLFDQHEIVYSNGAETESLFTGTQALKAIPAEAQAEIFALFPELRAPDYQPIAARHIPKGKMVRKLVNRVSKNRKPLFQTA